ncbi:glucose dehydrogenase [Caerostris extrusa]|uniref:Glucose dehydrogenase n=1 Tax=Caerostris extrusa TaxID=172846 RepID=A0AAV4Y8X3_CAEEX|nr:glucose dehydrogenase [Caerostris extrusa]
MVTKILFENRRAVGVEFNFRGRRHRVNATREVIISAGGINTAQLLMISGIGPMSELDRLRIPLVADLPVGQNLQEHPAGFVAFELDESVHWFILLEYLYWLFLSNNSTGEAMDLPDHELYFLELPAIYAKLRVGFTPEILHPKSRGTVRLRTTNPYDFPDIDPNYMDDPQDVKDIVEGMKNCIKILTAPPMAKVGAKMFNTTFPECTRFWDNLDLFLVCNARAALMSVSHPVGTAKMGQAHDPSTVVDPELSTCALYFTRVKTITGLRVIDSSVMPTIIWGNTNIPTIMIAEKGADMIKSTITCDPSTFG